MWETETASEMLIGKTRMTTLVCVNSILRGKNFCQLPILDEILFLPVFKLIKKLQ